MRLLQLTATAVAIILMATVLSPGALAQEQIEVQWSELAYVLEGRTVTTVLVDGTVLKGRVLDVSPTEARFEIKKTSNRDAYPKGEGPVPRDQLRVLSYTELSGNWRAIGTAIGAGATAVPGVILAAQFRNEGAEGVPLAAALIGVGVGLGYLGGHIADRHKHTVTLVVEKD